MVFITMSRISFVTCKVQYELHYFINVLLPFINVNGLLRRLLKYCLSSVLLLLKDDSTVLHGLNLIGFKLFDKR